MLEFRELLVFLLLESHLGTIKFLSPAAHGMVLGPATRDQFSARTSPGIPPGGTWHGPLPGTSSLPEPLQGPPQEAHGMVPGSSDQGPVLCQNLSRDPPGTSQEAHGMVPRTKNLIVHREILPITQFTRSLEKKTSPAQNEQLLSSHLPSDRLRWR